MAIAIAVFLLVLGVVPVLAAPASAESPGEAEAAQLPAPSPEEVAASERREEEEKEWLASPQAAHEREASQEAFSGISASEAKSLVVEAFPEAMASLNEDPGRVLTGLEVEKPLGTYAAVVGNGHGGERSLLETSVPVESKLGGEGSEPVDLDLKATENGFAPVNPITKLELPARAEGAIKLHEGVRVGLPASDDHEAVPLGEENLFIAETEPSTDTMLSPIAGGVAISEQLRSAASPEEFAFELELPKGATLRAAADGGAEAVSAEGAVIEEIPPPSAVDAQGAPVPVEMKANGERLVLEVPRHGSSEFAFPILVDPEILEEPKNFGAWTESNGGGFGLRNLGSSLNAYSQYNQTYYPETHAQWVYTAPGETAYIAAATFNSIDYLPGSCSSEQPHGYIGLYNVDTGSYDSLYTYHSPGVKLENWEFQTGWVGGPADRDAMIGIGTGDQAVNIGCYHELYVGGYSIQEKDLGPPAIDSVSGVPGGWFDPQEGEQPVTIVASDNGFGLHEESISDTGGPGAVTNYQPNLYNLDCPGTAAGRCPLHEGWSVYPAYQEGEHTLQVSAEDPIGNVTTWNATTKVDLGKPEIEFQGEFAKATEEVGRENQASENEAGENVLRLPVYSLRVKATDGSTATPERMLPGVRRVAIYLDGVEQKELAGPECPQSSCPVEFSYPVRLNDLAAGEHKLRIVAEDWLGHTQKREIELEYLPATGESDEYVMQHFPLGEGGEEAPGGPELAVNLMNGDLVYHERDLDLNTPSTDLKVERQYNSESPPGETGAFGEDWSLVQAPSLIQEGANEGGSSAGGPVLSGVGGSSPLETSGEVGIEEFDPGLKRSVTQLAGGRYELSGEGGNKIGSTVFSASGQPESQVTGAYSHVGYRYANGDLSKMVVEDPAATEAGVAEVEEAEGAGAPEHPVYEETPVSGVAAAGGISTPGGITLDPSGHLWVTDEEADRIEEFSGSGEPMQTFGSEGDGDGQLEQPDGLAVDREGDIWVADRGNRRIEEFGPEGEYVDQFPVAGSTGGLSPESAPSGVTVAANGDLWVSDVGADRIDVFTEAGTFVKSVGATDLEKPTAIAGDESGRFWVVDRALDKAVEFQESGEKIDELGSKGSSEGQFEKPEGVAADNQGHVWIADTGNGRVEEFLEDGEFLHEFGSEGEAAGRFRRPVGLAVNDEGHVWVAAVGSEEAERQQSEGSTPEQGGSEGTSTRGREGPVAAYSFDEVAEGGGTIEDASGNNHTATIHGARWTPHGRYGGAMEFGGQEGDYLSVPASSELNLTEEFTLEAWVRPEGNDHEWAPIVAKQIGDGKSPYNIAWWLYDGDGSEKPFGGTESPGHEEDFATGKEILPEDAWSHVAVTFDGAKLRLYVDGEPVATESAAAPRETGGEVVIGGGSELQNYFTGRIDELRIYDRDLSGAEIDSDMETPIATPRTGPVAEYSFDGLEEGAEAVEDLSDHGHTATIHGAKPTPAGRYGGAMEFKASEQDYLSVPDSPELSGAEELTIEAWVRPSDDTHQWQPIVDKQYGDGNNSPDYFDYRLYLQGEELSYGETQTGSGEEGVTQGPEPLPDDAWSHVALTYDGSRLRLYVDGELVDSSSPNRPPPQVTDGDREIGGSTEHGDWFDGRIDEVRIYDRGLSAAEVDSDMETPIQTPKAGPVAAYSFDEGEGTVAHDATGHGHEATIEGARWVSGKYGEALGFSGGGTQQCATVPDSRGLQLSQEFTIEAWVRPEGGEHTGPVVFKEAQPGSGFSYAMGIGFTQAGRLEGWAEGEGVYSPEALGEGDWTDIAYSYDGQDMRLFVNGKEVSDRDVGSEELESTGPLEIGCDGPEFAEQFKGRIDEVRIYDRALGEGEIAEAENVPVDPESASGLNWQVQKWGPSEGSAARPVAGGDPDVAFTTEGGDITAVQPSRGPEQQYEYEHELLTAHSGPEGEATYEYDAHHRLAKVSLPDGATATISYETIGRVSAVTVEQPGTEPKTTHFEYDDEPLETVVRVPEEPAVVYDIGPEGSVLRWHNVASPPEIESLSGSLWEQRTEIQPEPITPGDQNLLVKAYSPEGISSIKIVASGNQLVEEETCEQDYEKWGTECAHAVSEFVTDTQDWASGILPLEVIVTDSLGHIETKRFAVDVPYTPPPSAEAPHLPTFQEIKLFREEYDLDPDLKGNKLAMDERIFELIDDWNDPSTYLGEVSRASAAEWGVPLRPVDVAELEYRERYTDEDGPLIEEWALAHHPTTYAGYELDDRAGGLLRIGFTENQAQSVAEFIDQVHPVAADKITTFVSVPTRAIGTVEEVEARVTGAMESSPQLMAVVASVEVPEAGGDVDVEATNVEDAEAYFREDLGSLAGIRLTQAPGLAEPLLSREEKGGRILAGDRIWTDWTPTESPLFTWASAGFGAEESTYIPEEKRSVEVPFLLGAGHSGNLGTFMYREAAGEGKSGQYLREHGEKIGRVGRDALTQGSGAVDALATRLVSEHLAPLREFGEGLVGPAGVVHKHELVCKSGAGSESVSCGRVIGFAQVHLKEYPNHTVGSFRVRGWGPIEKGDSGGPVWAKETHESVGMLSSRPEGEHRIWNVQPLLTTNYGKGRQLTGALDASVMGGGSLTIMSDR